MKSCELHPKRVMILVEATAQFIGALACLRSSSLSEAASESHMIDSRVWDVLGERPETFDGWTTELAQRYVRAVVKVASEYLGPAVKS